jgi:hypothetical protein
MLKVVQRFGKHCSYHLQGDCFLVGCFWKNYIEQVVGGKWDVTKQTDKSGGAGCYPISDKRAVEERR